MGIWWRSGRKSAAAVICSSSRYNYPTPIYPLQMSMVTTQEPYISLPSFHRYLDPQPFLLRNYAGLAKVKAKEVDGKIQAANEHNGRRLNAEITAPEVRLISEHDNEIVSRQEALTRAKKLKLDLVEVQHNASPPVCKIMDYYKERYNQQQREKERAKNKPDLVLRKSECREIRFTSKTEQKDLERKAEMAKRLLERGYRVKCMAMGSGQETLEEQLLRISSLMKDFSIVENGPKVDKKGAWLIVKHIKFGHAKKNEAQETIKSVDISMSKLTGDNSKKTGESENMKLDRVAFPEDTIQKECSPFEEYAPLEKFEEFSHEEVSTVDAEGIHNAGALLAIDKVEGLSSADAHLTIERNNKLSSLNEEFKEECVSIEDQDTALNFKDFVADEVPSIDKVREVPTYAFKEEPVVVNSINSIEMKAKCGDSNGKHDAFDQPIETLSSTHSILHHYEVSNTGKQFPSAHHFNQSVDPTKVEDSEILNQELSALHMSALSTGAAEQDQLEKHKQKQSVPFNVSRQVMFGKIHSDQGCDVSNAERPQSADSVSESTTGFIRANANDATDNPGIHGSTASKTTNTVFEDLQIPPTKLNLAPPKGQQKTTNGTPKFSAASLRQALVSRSSGGQDKTGKQPLADILPKKANESRWAVLKQVKPAQFDGNTSNTQTSEVTCNTVQELKISPAATAAQESHSILVSSAQILAGGMRQVLVDSSSDNRKEGMLETGKQPLEDFPSKELYESKLNILGQHNPLCFNDTNNPTTSEIKSIIFEKVQMSTIDSNDDAATQDQVHPQNVAIDSHQIAAEYRGQIIGNCSSDNQEIRASKRGNEPLTDTILRKRSEPWQETFKQIKQPNYDDKHIAAHVQREVSNVKCPAVSDDTRQDPPCTSHGNKGHDFSEFGKQKPLASVPVPAKVSFETQEKFPQGQLLAIDSNEDATWQSEIEVKVLKQAISSEQKNMQSSGVQLINNPMPRDSLKIPDAKRIPQDDGRKISTIENPSSQGNLSVTGKHLPSSLGKQATVSGGSSCGIFSQPKISVVETQRHPGKLLENQSNPSSFDNYKDGTTTRAATRNSDHTKHIPEKEKHTFTWVNPSHFEGEDNTAQTRVFNFKHHSNNTQQNHRSCNSTEDNNSNIEMKTPIASDSTPVKVLQETYSKLSYGQSSAVNVNDAPFRQTTSGVHNTKSTILSEHEKENLSGVKSILVGHSPKNEFAQKSVDSSPQEVNKTGVSTYGISKQLPLSSARASNTAMQKDSTEIPICDIIQWDDVRKASAADSPRNQGSHASLTDKQSSIGSHPRKASVTGGSRWGIFSQQKDSVVQNQRDPVKMTQHQTQHQSRDPNILQDTNISASIETQNVADPRHRNIQTQMKVPISGADTPKHDLLQAENKAVTEPKQKGWGIFSKKVPS